MDPFVYEALPGRVVFGAGSFDQVPDEIERLQGTRVLLIADRSGEAWADQLAAALGRAVGGRIDDVRAHVPVERAAAAVALGRGSNANLVVTVGGGSATGLGKAVALELPVRILAVPTTYAGSEMTPIWGLTEGARKTTGRDPRVQPRTVVYDPVLTLSLPPHVAGPSGMNALAHCAEALYAAGANPITSLMAEKGMRILACGLPRIVAAPDDLDARGEVLTGAYLAGASFAAAGSSIHHKICHVLGGAYDLPHAEMHTVILPQALAFVAPRVPAAIARMAAALGEDDVPGAVFDLATRIGAPTALRDIGMPADRLGEAADLIVDAAQDGPIEVTVPGIRALLDAAFRGRRPPGADNTKPARRAASLDPVTAQRV
jgi:maleylacetate reductase